VTDVGDSELIVGDTGITVPRRQPEALAAALRKMFDMPREALGELGLKARQRIAEKFSLEKSIAAYETLYEEIALRSA
jgi:glycosyltransferase involved in cell wall biosynthesis